MKKKSLTIRMDKQVLDKIRVVSQNEGRSINRQIVLLLRRYIELHEKAYGEIVTESAKQEEKALHIRLYAAAGGKSRQSLAMSLRASAHTGVAIRTPRSRQIKARKMLGKFV